MPAIILLNPRLKVKLDPSPVTLESIQAAKRAALQELRGVAQLRAAAQGHTLGMWRSVGDTDIEVAHCRTCWAAAVVEVEREPHLCGPAISQVCPPRPDAFLANQHESVTRGGAR